MVLNRIPYRVQIWTIVTVDQSVNQSIYLSVLLFKVACMTKSLLGPPKQIKRKRNRNGRKEMLSTAAWSIPRIEHWWRFHKDFQFQVRGAGPRRSSGLLMTKRRKDGRTRWWLDASSGWLVGWGGRRCSANEQIPSTNFPKVGQ